MMTNPRAKPVPKHEGTADALIAQVRDETAGSRLRAGRTAHAAGNERGDPAAPIHRPRRHRWGEKSIVSIHKTERECLNGCGVVKVSRHEHNSHWVEYWRDMERISVDKVPACEPVGAEQPA